MSRTGGYALGTARTRIASVMAADVARAAARDARLDELEAAIAATGAMLDGIDEMEIENG